MKKGEVKYILECLQCGEVFCSGTPSLHKCKSLNSNLKDVLDLGDIDEIADSTITGNSRTIGIIQTPKND